MYKYSFLIIREQLQTEARVWKQTEHLWRFTSRSLFPGGQPLPGNELEFYVLIISFLFLQDWTDQSFEEVRWTYLYMTNQHQEHVYVSGYE